MGDMKQFRLNKKIVLSVLAVLGVLIIAGGAGVGLRLLQNSKDPTDTTAGLKARPLPENVDRAQNLLLTGDTDASLKQIDDSLKSDVPEGEKYQLLIQKGNAFYQQGDKDAAIAAYLDAEKLKATYEVATLLATKYEQLGNFAKAIEYNKKAIELIPKDSPVRNSDRQAFEEKITALEAKL